jgi:DNA-binding beta-propeller fold protein YncE
MALALGIGVPTLVSAAISNGMNASDLLGQYDDSSPTSPSPVYTKSAANNVPNQLGIYWPTGAVVDTVRHRLFVVDHINSRVLVFSLTSANLINSRFPSYVLGQPNFYTRDAATTRSGMNQPKGIAFDSANNRLFVSEQSNNRVTIFDLSSGISNGMDATYVLGQPDFTSSASAATQAGMNYPTSLAYDPSSHLLFVAERQNNRVSVFDLTSGITNGMNASYVLGQSGFTSSSAATTQVGLSQPYGVHYETSSNRLFVTELGNNRVTVFSGSSIATGMAANSVLGQRSFTTSTAATTQSGLSLPIGVAYDTTRNRLYIGDYGNNRVMVFSGSNLTHGMLANTVIGQSSFTTSTAATTQSSVRTPYNLFYDTSSDRLYVSEGEGNSRVTIFNGAAIGIGMNASDLLGQYDDSASSPQPVYTKSAANNAPNQFGLSGPQGITIDTTNHRLFLADYNNNRVLVYTLTNGNTLNTKLPSYVLGQPNFYTNTAATTGSGMRSPIGLTYDNSRSRLYVSDSGNNRVLVYSGSTLSSGMIANTVLGQADFVTSTARTTQSGMSLPFYLAFDTARSRLYVADYSNNRVLVFSGATIGTGMRANTVLGQSSFTTSTAATTQTGMRNPAGLAYDSTANHLFVSDYTNNRILVFSGSSLRSGMSGNTVLGQSTFTTSVSATTRTGMGSPHNMAFDSGTQRLFVGDPNNNRVLVFNGANMTNGMRALNVLGQSSFTTSTAAATRSGFNLPNASFYNTADDTLFVGQWNNNRVSIFDAAEATPTFSYSVSSGVATLTLTDEYMNTSSSVDSVSLTLTTQGGDSESLTLQETGAETGIFTASFPMRSELPQTSNGVVQDNTAPGSVTVTAAYTNVFNQSVSYRETVSLSSSSSTTSTSTGGGGGGGGGAGRGVTTITPAGQSSSRSSSSAPSTDSPASPEIPSSESSPSTLIVERNGQTLRFNDVPLSSWFTPYVRTLVERGIASGYEDAQGNSLNLFKPSNPVTYAEALKMMLLSGGKEITQGTPANLSAKNDWSAPYVKTAEDLKLSVYTKNLPVQSPASRGALLQSWLEIMGVPMTTSSENPFSDLPTSHPHYKAILTAYQIGIISGDTDAQGNPTGTVRPDDTINRAELAKILTILPDLSMLQSSPVETTSPVMSNAYVITEDAALHVDARSQSLILGYVKKGEYVTLLRTVDVWAEVRTEEGRQGFVSWSKLSK